MSRTISPEELRARRLRNAKIFRVFIGCLVLFVVTFLISPWLGLASLLLPVYWGVRKVARRRRTARIMQGFER
jgi:hypothetical protein